MLAGEDYQEINTKYRQNVCIGATLTNIELILNRH